ncbi:MAG: transcriptional regulator [Novosphingobium sp.]
MELTPTPFEALQSALARAGSQSELARICGVSQPAVWKWLQSSKRLPAEYVLRVENATGVSRHHLRPDIYPLESRGSHPRWYGVDMASGPDVAVVSAVQRKGNGNRINVLDVREQRRTA